MLDGQPFRRILERDGKPLSPAEQLSEQKKLDRESRKLNSETPAEKKRRMDDTENRRRREFAFLSEIPDLYDLRLEADSTIDGRPVWVVSGKPRPGATAKSSDAKMLLKVRGRMWDSTKLRLPSGPVSKPRSPPTPSPGDCSSARLSPRRQNDLRTGRGK